MKKKLPQPSKSGKEKADDKFCILEAEQHIDKIKEDFLFDVVECKKAKIIHEFIVKDVILPKEKINDFEKLRMLAKKKIEVVRKVNANCKQSEERKEVVV